MLYKTIIISIVVAVSFISSVENVSVITCHNDKGFLEEAKKLQGETFAIIVYHKQRAYPNWMQVNLQNDIQKFLLITHNNNGRHFLKTIKYLKAVRLPTLFVVKADGFLSSRKLLSNRKSEIDLTILDARDLDPSRRASTRPLVEDFEKFLTGEAEAQSTPIDLTGSTSARTEGSSNLGGQSDTGLNLNEPASMEDNSFRLFGTNLQTNANDDVHTKKLTSGGEIAPSAQVIWLFGEPYTYDAPSGGLSKSPPTQIVSSSGKQSMSPPAPTGPNSRKHSISPSAPGGSSKGKHPRSPSLPPQKKSKN